MCVYILSETEWIINLRINFEWKYKKRQRLLELPPAWPVAMMLPYCICNVWEGVGATPQLFAWSPSPLQPSLPHAKKRTQQANPMSIETNNKTQVKSQWIVTQRLLSALTIPVLSGVACKEFAAYPDVVSRVSPRSVMIVRMYAISWILKHACLQKVWGQRCNPNQDSDLEAFSRNPTDGSFAVIKYRLTAFTIYPNEVFLSYWLRFLLQCQFDQ